MRGRVVNRNDDRDGHCLRRNMQLCGRRRRMSTEVPCYCDSDSTRQNARRVRRHSGELDLATAVGHGCAGPKILDRRSGRNCGLKHFGPVAPVEEEDQLPVGLAKTSNPQVPSKNGRGSGWRAELAKHLETGRRQPGEVIAREQHTATGVNRRRVEVVLIVAQRTAKRDAVRIVPPEPPVLPVPGSSSRALLAGTLARSCQCRWRSASRGSLRETATADGCPPG